MTRVPSGALLRQVFLTLSALGVFSFIPSDVHAECGDYVTVGNARSKATHSFKFTASSEIHVADGSIGRLAHSNPNPTVPCYGPACSDRAQDPTNPTKASAPSLPDWALSEFPITMVSTEPVPLDLVPISYHASHRFEPILRPPRVD